MCTIPFHSNVLYDQVLSQSNYPLEKANIPLLNWKFAPNNCTKVKVPPCHGKQESYASYMFILATSMWCAHTHTQTHTHTPNNIAFLSIYWCFIIVFRCCFCCRRMVIWKAKHKNAAMSISCVPKEINSNNVNAQISTIKIRFGACSEFVEHYFLGSQARWIFDCALLAMHHLKRDRLLLSLFICI